MPDSPTSGNGFSDLWKTLIIENAAEVSALRTEMAQHREAIQENTAALRNFGLKVGVLSGSVSSVLSVVGVLLAVHL